MVTRRRTESDRFWPNLEENGEGCWEWTASRSRAGYGRFWSASRKREVPAHRWAYEALRADIPDGLQLDHLCYNPPCVNPWHLEPVTGAENHARRRVKPVCPNGHPYAGDNLLVVTRKDGKLRKLCGICRYQPTPSSSTRHGTPGAYTNHRCRCELCRAAWSVYIREVKKRKTERDPDWREGEYRRLADGRAGASNTRTPDLTSMTGRLPQ